MRKLTIFESVSLDGFFADANGAIEWADENTDDEWNDFTSKNAAGPVEMVFGRVTYELMKSFWPTAEAKRLMPQVAKTMNDSTKIVFSKSLKDPGWHNARVVNADVARTLRELKTARGPDLLILGSGTIVAQCARAGLIDELTIVTTPVVLGEGKRLFENRFRLGLTSTRRFKNGNVVSTYTPKPAT